MFLSFEYCNSFYLFYKICDIPFAGCPLNSNQKNDKKMTIFLVKNEKKLRKCPKKCKKNTMKAKLKIN